MLDSKVLNTDYDLAEMKDLCLPNLLDNADFKSGIINQRGQSSYNGTQGKNTYTIDRWCVGQHTNLVLTVADGYISMSLPNLQWIAQFIEYQPEGAMTVAIKIKGSELKVLSLSNYVNDNGTLKYDFGELQTNVFACLYKYPDDENWQFYILNKSGGTVNLNIEYIKLEKGSVFTGMPVWNYALEWFNCQRYLYFVGSSSILNARYDGSNLFINFKTPMSFVNKPSIIHNNAIFGVTSFNGSYENHNVSDFTVSSYGGGNINIIKPSSNPTRYGMAIVVDGFYLDAETYKGGIIYGRF